MRRLGSIRFLIGCLMLLGCIEPEAPAPNGLILISLDTLRADRVGMQRGGRSITASIDRLAADGVLFEECIAQAPSTLPSHASIMTSLLPPHHGAYYARKSKLAPGVVTLAEIFSQAGFRTASFNGGAQLAPVWGLDRGFDRYESDIEEREARSGVIERDDRLIRAVEKTLGWLAEDDSQPYFAFVHSFEVHSPYSPLPGDVEALASGPTEGYRKHVSVEDLQAINDGIVPIGSKERQEIQDAYNAEIISADRAIGHFVSRLKEMGLYEDTVIVFTSDHGEEFGERGMMGWHSHTLYDELLHVPLIIKFPGNRFAGTRVATQVRSIDIAPTALGSLGIEIPAQFIGKDLATRADSGWQWDLPALSYQDTPKGVTRWSLRETRWKLNDGLLFDLDTDPAERSSHRKPGQVRRLRAASRVMLRERPVVGTTSIQPTAETEENLRALGYVVE